jgi:hypothetical protein
VVRVWWTLSGAREDWSVIIYRERFEPHYCVSWQRPEGGLRRADRGGRGEPSILFNWNHFRSSGIQSTRLREEKESKSSKCSDSDHTAHNDPCEGTVTQLIVRGAVARLRRV